MKKISVAMISLVLLVSILGINSVFGCCVKDFYATNDTVHVGQFITIVSVDYTPGSCTVDPSHIIVQNGDETNSDKAILVSSRCDPGTGTLTVTYRAVKQGDVYFKYAGCQKPLVKILPKPHPMFSFMKILGLGKSD
ncbi:MAG: hypothetical protein AMQ22_00658 [Candidatus Methanofastidiosum methylothiophilum]|uniref:Uncharacterized protein n=1 Tax=Candidatus Methanofastidiosum methylothiophilum TaxID=1705564 RepID=A0A150J639_9EURY|nr:MAG: hypothetical protein AMQ22_00658 [Candidatus Methanofastidiosum methylthiophilus]